MRRPILWNHDYTQMIGSCDSDGNIELETPINLDLARIDGVIQVTEYETTNEKKLVKRAKLVALSLIPDDIGCQLIKKSDKVAFDKGSFVRKRKDIELNLDESITEEVEEKKPDIKQEHYGFTKKDINKGK